MTTTTTTPLVLPFEQCRRGDVARVGGKNASLGEMVSALATQGIAVPPGFATTADGFRLFLRHNDLEARIEDALGFLATGDRSLAETGRAIRAMIEAGEWPGDLAAAILDGYLRLSERLDRPDLAVAVRSSATAEDLPDASFAGQQETFLNVAGAEAVLRACRRCFASLYTDRAIVYREARGFEHAKVALSVGVQAMVRADEGGSGTMFSIDPETGFRDAVVIDAAWGLGELVVQGAVDPDETVVFKPLLAEAALVPIVEKRLGAKREKMVLSQAGDIASTRIVPTALAERERFVLEDEAALRLARWAVLIEKHYGCPMDIEWARDGADGPLFVVQARPETVQSRRDATRIERQTVTSHGATLAKGLAIGDRVVSALVNVIRTPDEIDRFEDDAILVTGTTDPDWVPIMKRAAGIVTDHGGRTSHAAIVSRELGLPAIVGTGDATRVLHSGQHVTLSCASGDEGYVYAGAAEVETSVTALGDMPRTRTKVMLNLANPSAAFRWAALPSDGVGLARMEFVVANHVRVHPMALLRPEALSASEREAIAGLTRGHRDPADYFVERLARGLARIAAAVHPRPVTVRFSDFKTNEYAGLLGGRAFEPVEENPMLGFRGASRYYSEAYRHGFALECRAIRYLREAMGFTNVGVMIPFCRSVGEADRVLDVMAENGLRRGERGLRVLVMCEIPSNVIRAEAFAERFDGFSIGSNDLTQLTLGIDRDNEALAHLFDERDPAVEWMIGHLMTAAHGAGASVSLCGQAPSDHPDFARLLVRMGIDAISVTPDSFAAVKAEVAAAEHELGLERAAREMAA